MDQLYIKMFWYNVLQFNYSTSVFMLHDDDIKWKHFPHYWPFVHGIHWSPINSPHKGEWREALMFSLICAWTNGWVNKRDASQLRCHHAHYDITVMDSDENACQNYTRRASIMVSISLTHIWQHRSWLTLAKFMACCMMAPSHYLNQCWLHPSWGQFHKMCSWI